MTITQTTFKNGKYQNYDNPSRRLNQAGKTLDQQSIDPVIISKPLFSDGSFTQDKGSSGSIHPNRRLIQGCLKRIAKKGLYGRPHVKRYLSYLHRSGCRSSTIRSNIVAIILFLSYLKTIGRTYIETVIRDDLSRFIEHEQDRGLKPNTVYSRLQLIYAFLTYLADSRVVNPDLLKKKLKIKVPDTLPRAMDPDDVRGLLSVIRKLRDWAMILILLRTGMRIGELLNTKVKDIHLKEKRIDIIEACKTRAGRVVYLSADACLALRIWLKKRDPKKENLFYGQGRERLGYESARMMFKKYLVKAGLSHKEYTLHCLRHTYASELLNAGMRLECLQQLLGHNNIEVTRRYARLTDNTRREEYFKAMQLIEKGRINGHYRCDP